MTELPPLPDDPLVWVGGSLEELRAMPEDLRRRFGFALRFAQAGETPRHAKVLRGFRGAGVLEVVEDYQGNTYRAVYTVKLAGVVYVLHCFQKKSKTGIATPKPVLDLIKRRLRHAEILHAERTKANGDT